MGRWAKRAGLVITWVIAGMLSAAPAWAEAPVSDDIAGRVHYDAGQRFYQGGRYTEALAEFRAGYALTKRPAFLVNIGQAERQLGQLEAARESYRRFVELSPQSALRPEIESIISELGLELERQNEQRRQSAASELGATKADARRTPVYKKWWLWTIVGGAVAVGLGVGLGVGLSSQDGPLAPAAMTTNGTYRPFAASGN